MRLDIHPSDGPFGARARGVDLSGPLSDSLVDDIREAWLAHKVLAFPDQRLTLEDLERFCARLGPFSEDPFIAPLPDHPHVIEVKREAEETSPIFAETWHSDWSFLPTPPAGTALYGVEIPPVGGDTLFADQHAAYAALPDAMKRRIDGLLGVHSAARGYARNGMYGDKDVGRSMDIRPSDDALKTQTHPVVRAHRETGAPALFVNMGYTQAIEGMEQEEGWALLLDLFRHQQQPQFVYRHAWSPGMLTLWDNRWLTHCATGGYQGHRRLLWRMTIGEQPS
ncbi:MAG: TauD/TfdA family dioxygenase [Alphaproteobacteria bacterium]|nr:TauD/TfdA family dioxygenase [Alphaproteobacteria bacterium]